MMTGNMQIFKIDLINNLGKRRITSIKTLFSKIHNIICPPFNFRYLWSIKSIIDFFIVNENFGEFNFSIGSIKDYFSNQFDFPKHTVSFESDGNSSLTNIQSQVIDTEDLNTIIIRWKFRSVLNEYRKWLNEYLETPIIPPTDSYWEYGNFIVT